MRKKFRKLLVTGGAGFIGSEFVRQAVKKSYKVGVIDCLTYAGDSARLKSVRKNISFYRANINNISALENIFHKERPDALVHFAAETHVDRSIKDARPFIQTNVLGTNNCIQLALKYKIKRFVHMSTDEVYGASLKGRFKEHVHALNPKNPYASTKAAAEHLLLAAVNTYGLGVIVVRPANNYGPWQYPEKFIPVIILKALKNQRVPVYGKGLQIREWLHVSDCANGIHVILSKGKAGEIYNIGSTFEKTNIVTAKSILKLMGKPESLIQFVRDRPGHDFRYSVDCTKLRKLGWEPKVNFKIGIRDTVHWYLENLNWLEQKYKYLQKYWKKIYKKA